MRLIRIGYWDADEAQVWPDVRQFVDTTWNVDERNIIADYLRRGFVARACMGFSQCRVCGSRRNGSLELSDGVFIWPEGLAHYVELHAIRLPARFVDHALSKTDQLEAADIDDEWWRGVSSPDQHNI